MSAGTPEIFRVREEAPEAGLGLPLSLSPTSETDRSGVSALISAHGQGII